MDTGLARKGYLLVITLALLAALCACHKSGNDATNAAQGDPANGNLAPASDTTAQNTGISYSQPGQQQQSYSSQGNPSGGQAYYPPGGSDDYYPPAEDAEEPPVEASEPPPPLPDYEQPPCPGDGYMWTPGYWAYADSDYYWVPGAWVMAPWVDALWTPPWWGFYDGVYVWHAGYWGPHIGFYGGIDYDFGYTGHGYYGAYWRDGVVNYNRSVTNVNTTAVQNVYNYPVAEHHGYRTSYNGGRGGVSARPTPQEMAVARDPRSPAVPAQTQHARQASTNRAQFAQGRAPHPASLVAAGPLPTPYRKPAQQPPAAAVRNAQRMQARASLPSNERPGAQPPQRFQPQQRTPPQQEGRPGAPQAPAHGAPQARIEQQRTVPAQPPRYERQNAAPPPPQGEQARPAPARPQPPRSEVYRPAPQPQVHPQPQARPQPPPAREQPANRPAPRPAEQHAMMRPAAPPPHVESARPAPPPPETHAVPPPAQHAPPPSPPQHAPAATEKRPER